MSRTIYNLLTKHFFTYNRIEKVLKIVVVNSRKPTAEACQQVIRRWKFIS